MIGACGMRMREHVGATSFGAGIWGVGMTYRCRACKWHIIHPSSPRPCLPCSCMWVALPLEISAPNACIPNIVPRPTFLPSPHKQTHARACPAQQHVGFGQHGPDHAAAGHTPGCEGLVWAHHQQASMDQGQRLNRACAGCVDRGYAHARVRRARAHHQQTSMDQGQRLNS
jgi:hypothetical protein